MKRLNPAFGLLISVLSTWFSYGYGQSTYPDVPTADYVVYSAVLNTWSNCSKEGFKHRRGGLLLLSTTTEVPGKHGFRADFNNLDHYGWHKSSIDSLLKQDAWRKFITAVDTSQFTKRTTANRLTLQCRQAVMWTDSMSNYYFGRGAPGKRYVGLRKDYEGFDSIIRFSNVVYSADRSKALCYFSETSDNLAGGGYLVLLEKSPASWRFVGWLMLWIS